MFKGVRIDELDVATFDGYRNYPFLGNSSHLQEQGTP